MGLMEWVGAVRDGRVERMSMFYRVLRVGCVERVGGIYRVCRLQWVVRVNRGWCKLGGWLGFGVK